MHPVKANGRKIARGERVISNASLNQRKGNVRRQLREILSRPGCEVMPCCHDALSGKLIQRAGFEVGFISGFTTSAAKLAVPDAGLITFTEMLDQGTAIVEGTSIPFIIDGDTGYGNAMNVKRTVRAYTNVGLAGLMLEDQISPKSCGHVKKKAVIDRQESVSRIQAAIDARDEIPVEEDRIVIIGRTDSRQAVSIEEALWRVSAFADMGVDIVFVDALQSKEEMKKVCKLAQSYNVPVLANMLEGGKTPILSIQELEDIGYKLAAYPLSLLGVSINAMQKALEGLKAGTVPSNMPSFQEIQDIVGFDEYFRELDYYETGIFTTDEQEWDVEDDKETYVAEIVVSNDEEDKIAEKQLKVRILNDTTGAVIFETILPDSSDEDMKDILPLIQLFAGMGNSSVIEEKMRIGKTSKAYQGGQEFIVDFKASGKRIQVYFEDK